MSYTVSASQKFPWSMYPDDTVTSVLRNVALVLSTPMGSVPLYRDYGLDMSYLDLPTPIARARMISVLREAVEKWEPRAVVVGVSFQPVDPADPGRLNPIVEVEIPNA